MYCNNLVSRTAHPSGMRTVERTEDHSHASQTGCELLARFELFSTIVQSRRRGRSTGHKRRERDASYSEGTERGTAERRRGSTEGRHGQKCGRFWFKHGSGGLSAAIFEGCRGRQPYFRSLWTSLNHNLRSPDSRRQSLRTDSSFESRQTSSNDCRRRIY